MSLCVQCGESKGNKEDICYSCLNTNFEDVLKIDQLVVKENHTYHCARRIVWGDGECECEKGDRK